jgi:hypothetical protein
MRVPDALGVFFELAYQPVEVPVAVTTEEATRLFDRLRPRRCIFST